jgi:peptidoglycan lytic transglycosylase F
MLVRRPFYLIPAWRKLAPLTPVLLLPFALSCSVSDATTLQAIKRAGEIRVLTYAGTATYYETPDGVAGFEYDLAKAFADHIGVRLRVVVADRFADILPRLLAGDADFAAANITETPERRAQVHFSPSYQKVSQQVVYRLGSTRPAKIDDLIGREIEIQAGTRAAERLRALKQSYPQLAWTETEDTGPEEYLQLVWEGLLDLTVANSNLVTLDRQYFPELQVAFDLGDPEPVAWAFRSTDEPSVLAAAKAFLQEYRDSGALAQLVDRYYGPARRSNFINLTVFRARVHNRLPNYQQALEDAGKKYKLDWRLLAAMAYQESYWNPKSVSYTGVRGFMMLTRDTASELGIDDRQDVDASIDGGARYLRDLLDRLPPHIESLDRLWFALAAYNIGLYHLEDARALTQEQGGDPDKWTDVRKRLPLLADPKWTAHTKYGYARGEEAARFVSRVRVYYDVLTKIDNDEQARRATPAAKLRAPAL